MARPGAHAPSVEWAVEAGPLLRQRADAPITVLALRWSEAQPELDVSFSFTSKLAAFCLLGAAAVPVVAVHRWWIWLDVVWLAMGGLALLLWPDRTAHRFRDGPFGPVRGRSMSILSIQQTRIDAAPADSDSFRNYKATPKDSVRAYNFFAFFGVLYALREWHAAIAVAVILGTGYLVLGRRALSQHDSLSG